MKRFEDWRDELLVDCWIPYDRNRSLRGRIAVVEDEEGYLDYRFEFEYLNWTIDEYDARRLVNRWRRERSERRAA